MTTINLFLLIAALLLLMVWAVPDPVTCWLPAEAPTRGMYESCWLYSEIII